MFILDTIKPSKKKNILLEAPIPIRAVSLLFTLIGYFILYLNIVQGNSTAYAYSILLIIFICANMYFLFFYRILKLSNDGKKLILNLMFVGLIVRQSIFELDKIESFFFEDRKMGQIISSKLRLFIKYKNQDFNVGVVNQKEKSEYILNKLNSLIKHIE